MQQDVNEDANSCYDSLTKSRRSIWTKKTEREDVFDAKGEIRFECSKTDKSVTMNRWNVLRFVH